MSFKNSRFKSSLELMLCVIDISTLNKTYLIDLGIDEIFQFGLISLVINFMRVSRVDKINVYTLIKTHSPYCLE